MNFKVGNKARCINNYGWAGSLTVGRVYPVKNIENEAIFIETNFGNDEWFKSDMFELVVENCTVCGRLLQVDEEMILGDMCGKCADAGALEAKLSQPTKKESKNILYTCPDVIGNAFVNDSQYAKGVLAYIRQHIKPDIDEKLYIDIYTKHTEITATELVKFYEEKTGEKVRVIE